MLLWSIASLAMLAALLALFRARRLHRRLEDLSHSYWELRYDYTRLRAQVNRLDPERQEAAEPPPAPPPASTVAFVPLTSLKQGDGPKA